MGKMDARTRAYVRGNEVFADICNYMLYQGKQVICADQLREKDPVELILPLKDEKKGISRRFEIIWNYQLKQLQQL